MPVASQVQKAKEPFPDHELLRRLECYEGTVGGVGFHDAAYGIGYTPPSRRRGGRDLNKMPRSILCGADGVVVSSYRFSNSERVWIIGGLKQPPRLRR